MATFIEKSIINRLEEIREKYNMMSALIGDPEFSANRAEFQRVVKEQGELTPIVEKYNQYKELCEKLEEAEELINDASTEDDMKELALEEKKSLENELEVIDAEIKTLLLPKDPRDTKNVIMEIRAGAGGDEAALFAAELFRMYAKYAEKKRWKLEVLSSNYIGIGGIKEIICPEALPSGQRQPEDHRRWESQRRCTRPSFPDKGC